MCAALSLAAAAVASASDAAKLFEQARELYQDGEYQKSLELVRKIEIMEPGRVVFDGENLHNLKGSCFTALRYFQHGRKAFRDALEAQPENFDMHYNLAEMDFLQEHFQAAAEKFSALKEFERGRIYNDLLDYKIGMCRLMQGKPELVRRDLELHSKQSAVTLFLKAALALREKKPEQAEIQLLLAKSRLLQENYLLYEDSLVECGLLEPPPLEGRAREQARQTRRRPLSLGIGRIIPRPEPKPSTDPSAKPESTDSTTS